MKKPPRRVDTPQTMRRPQPPQQLRAVRTRQHLLAAAQRVFAERGYDGATVDDIADAAGCSKGAYYFHFASKEDVLVALVDDWTAQRSERLSEALSGGRRAAAGLAGVLDALFAPETDGWQPRLMLEIWSQGERNAQVKRRLARAERSWRRLLSGAFERAQQAGSFPSEVTPEAAAETVLALHQGLVVRASLRLSTKASSRERASAALALLTGRKTLRRAG